MEHATCNVLYVDRGVRQDRYLRSSQIDSLASQDNYESPHIAENAKLLLDVFGEVHLISSGGACLSQWLDLQDTSMIDLKPTLILIDTPYEDRLPEKPRSRSPSPHSAPPIEDEEGQNHEEELYGLALMQRIVSESYLRNLSRLVVPVAIVTFPSSDCPDIGNGFCDARDEIANRKFDERSSKDQRTANRRMVKRCLDLGATDVMANPMNIKRITNLEVHAYRAHRDAARDQKAILEVRRGRKRSWVGISEEKPFAYLREAMVSGLMNGICRVNCEQDDPVGNFRVSIPVERQAVIADAVGHWHFCAHDFSDDELIVAASIMFKHALSMPELEAWRIPTDQLHSFLMACRAAYNNFVPYHNFRHVVDVLQATFSFLIHIGALPWFPSSSSSRAPKKSPIAQLLEPFDALTLLVTAIGHDVGHPGVNNGFLTKLNAPLAQLYNDRSVLESFHCAAYSQILRRYWKAAFEDSKMRTLMISSILATDMGLHFDYMKKMGDVQAKLHENNSTDGWNGRMIEEQKALACALLIKCADISNVARRHDTALQWMHILSDEFSRQASMEEELKIPTSLMAPPKNDMVSLGKAQLNFMNLFAIPLFQGVADLMPGMQYCVDELEANRTLFELTIAEERSKADPVNRMLQRDGTFSPRTMSMNIVNSSSNKASPTAADAVPALKPSILENKATTGKEFLTRPASPVDKLAHVPQLNRENEVVAEFRANNPFNIDDQPPHAEKQRCSETTEGGSLPSSVEWASGATSATTGKMPLSPSTQGTSIISRDSMDRPVSVPVTTITASESTTTAPDSAKSQADLKIESQISAGNQSSNEHSSATLKVIEAEPDSRKMLKKKPSRFRINGLHFFRRHKNPSPTVSATDTAG